MRLPLAALMFVVCLATTRADDKPRPTLLSQKEAAEGWLQLFDGETTFGWKVEGEAAVKDGVLHLRGANGKAAVATLATRFGAYDAVIEAEGAGFLTYVYDGGESGVGLTDQPCVLTIASRLRAKGDGISSNLEVGPDGVARSKIDVKLSKRASLRISTQPGGTVKLKAAKLKPGGLEPLFNGKDLAGWKVFDDPKRAATKFEVTPAGDLSAKNGPGDLQTERQFDDFVLQLECKTNGKWLNSGVFFRCVPNQYQNGYEMQIQNAYTGEDRTKPIDFGTGAIYRRVPARRVVSNDNEWFTMTLAADEKHFATWVNGYQTVDWTDDRPANDNPRQGYRAAKGHLSIQGHDPTTDLLFRNIRIAELPKK